MIKLTSIDKRNYVSFPCYQIHPFRMGNPRIVHRSYAASTASLDIRRTKGARIKDETVIPRGAAIIRDKMEETANYRNVLFSSL